MGCAGQTSAFLQKDHKHLKSQAFAILTINLGCLELVRPLSFRGDLQTSSPVQRIMAGL